MAFNYEPRVKRKYVGQYNQKIDAAAKTLGKVEFLDDITLKGRFPGMLYARTLRSPYANARIKSMDTSAAQATPGVHAILRYDDPEVLALKPSTECWTDTGITSIERDTLIRFWDRRILGDTARWVGDHLGVAIAAETEELAEQALKAVKIDWEILSPPMMDWTESSRPGAHVIHPEINPEGNQLPHHNPEVENDLAYDKGDVERAFQEADAWVEVDETYGGNSVHATLDYRGCMAIWEEHSGKLTVWTNHYFNDQTRMFLHGHLGLPLAKIRVHNGYCGGHMGKWNMGEKEYYITTALLSKRAKAPVKYQMNLHEEFHEGRNLIRFKLKMAAKDGKITAVQFNGVGDSGAYYGGNEYLVEYMLIELSEVLFAPVKNVRAIGRGFFSNRMPGAVMRGIGNVQCCFAFCQAVDQLAYALHMDPIDLAVNSLGNEIHGAPNDSLAAVLKAGAQSIGWGERLKPGEGPLIDGYKKRGLGMSFHNLWHAAWQENIRGRVEIAFRVNPDLSVILNAPTAETGSGANSCVIYSCAEQLDFLNVTPDDITWICEGDTEQGLRDVHPSDSVCSWLMSELMPEAAQKIKKEFCNRAALLMGVHPDSLDVADAKVFMKSDPSHYMNASDVMALDDNVPISAHVIRNNNKTLTGIPYASWFADVEVDVETGEVEVKHLVHTSDAGQVMHAAGAEGQQIGGQCIGVGESLFEEIDYDKRTGTPLNMNYIDYKIPLMKDFPDVDPQLLEVWKGAGEYGACGIGEAAGTGTAAAIANAIYNAVGVRIDSVPFTPSKILKALAEKEKEESK